MLSYVSSQILDYRPPEAFIDLFLAQDYAIGFLSDGGLEGRYSYLAAHPTHIGSVMKGTFAEIKSKLSAYIEPLQAAPHLDLPPFSGGVVGLSSFELGLSIEGLEHDAFRLGSTDWPELSLMVFPAVLAFDHHKQRLLAIGRGANNDEALARRDQLLAFITSQSAPDLRPQRPFCAELIEDVRPNEATFQTKVADLVERIRSGDLFQANLARALKGRLTGTHQPAHVLSALMSAGPAPFAAFFKSGLKVIVSNSPERFIRLDAHRQIKTMPIKGTRPRGDTPEQDRALAAELLASEKDCAENLMIVDLMRHDVSKVAKPGSVQVSALCALMSFPSVHHLVSTIEAELLPDMTAADLIMATHPPGSISGAPKIAALKVITAVEAARGPYCGSLFYVDATGAMDSNVLIRTLVFEQIDQVWHFRLCAGGGIVAYSDPEDEFIETQNKLALIRDQLLK